MVVAVMLGAEIHVCPSYVETPGLANLEAAAMGCKLVLGDCPPVRDYFGDDAVYVQADNVADIRGGVMRARQRPCPAGLPDKVLRDYTWQAAGEASLLAYRRALANEGIDIATRAV